MIAPDKLAGIVAPISPTHVVAAMHGRRMLLAILALSLGLRIALVLGGGQFFWPDENRYFEAKDFAARILAFDLAGATDLLLQHPAHNGFMLIAALPVLLERLLSSAGLPAASVDYVPALTLSLASLASISLMYGLTLKAGGHQREALLAAFLLACATSMLFYARHLLPYDSAMALVLLALWIGLGSQRPLWRSFGCGLLAGLATLTYNGYWLMALAALMLHPLFQPRSAWALMARYALAAAGASILPGALVLASLARGASFVEQLSGFAGTIRQGAFDEGWRLPWAYLWHAEHGLLLVWLMGAAALAWLAIAHHSPARRRGLCWLAGVVAVYLLLWLGSNVFERFVVYGRLARQMVPFLCLTTACALTQLADIYRWPRIVEAIAAAALLTQTGLNVAMPLAQWFPANVQAYTLETYGLFTPDVTLKDVPVQPVSWSENWGYILLNAQYLYQVGRPKDPPAGRVVFRTPHPLQFLPYLYEGYTPSERTILRSVDISMRVVDIRMVQP